MKKNILFILGLALFIRLINLNELPKSLFGDVIYHLNLAKSFAVVRWAGDGAMFPLITSIFARILGFNFMTLKLISLAFSILGVGAIMLYAKTLTKSTSVALLTGLFATFSFWSIAISHLGKPISLVPLFVALIGYFLLKKQFVRAGIFIGLALYTQTAAWGMFIFSFVHPIVFISSLLAGFFFFREFATAPDTFFGKSSHIGEKLQIDKYSLETLIPIIAIISYNLFRQTRGLFIYGDLSFRSTVPGQPLLDPITGFFVIFGVLFGLVALGRIYKRKRSELKKYFWPVVVCLILPYFFVQLPAAMDINNLVYIPNNERISGVMPFVFTVAGWGLWQFLKSIKISKVCKNIFICIIFIVIASINLYRYWVTYPKTLPNKNVGFAEEIGKVARDIDSSTAIFIVGAEWGEWGQPEGNAFEFVDAGERKLSNAINEIDICFNLQNYHKAVIFVAPDNNSINTALSSCRWKVGKTELLKVKEQLIAKQLTISR